MNTINKKEILFSPMLATFGGGSARGFKQQRLGGGSAGAIGSAISTLDILNDGSCKSCLPLNSNATDLNTNNSTTSQSTSNPGGITTSYKKWGTGSWFVPDGSASQYVYVEGIDLSGGNGSFTMSAWFRLNNIRASGIQPVLFLTSGSSTKGEGQITVASRSETPNNSNRNYGKGGSGQTSLDVGYDTGQDITYDTWYHGLHTYNSVTDEYKMYLDNTLYSTVTNASTKGNDPPGLSSPSNVDILLGHEPDSFHPFGSFDGGQCLAGFVDQVRIFNKALDATEVGYVYNEQLIS